MSSELLRSEAVDHARQRWGSPASYFGLTSWILVGFFIAVFASAATFICLANYTKKETVLGSVVPDDGVVRVSPMRSGLVKEVFVKSGQAVRKGEALFSISYDVTLEDGAKLSERINATTDAQNRATQTQVRLRKAQLAEDAGALLVRRDGLEADVAAFQKQKAIQADRVILLESTVKSSRELFEQRFVSAVQLRQREDALLLARQSLVQSEQSIQQTQNQIQQIERQIRGLRAQIASSEADLALSRAQMEEKRLTEASGQGGHIVAAQSGRMTSVQARAGDIVNSGQSLAMIVPETARRSQVVQLWAPSRAVGFVRKGDRVRVMFDAFPYQTFGVGEGKVVEVSTAPVMPADLPVPIETDEQMYKIVVALDRNDLTAYGRSWPLMPGMRLTADLVLDERSLLDWLLDPLIAAQKRAAG
ncbi:HlyD family efflux transporter periplasmic adaptor subunit [Asticcacaulis sp. DXS10W]|uniref:HlyD family efflux transporter periplasmic adaptor subunit n=1 Tax=Asticcacaulis currens TaxID=2984210 RepID=A0ABT5IBW9_9CAUL|nr:HlyD family efflux transporter periplasmic adaptor subunit [Asticcacaulis currens]MDC7693463.1 HlyD family efflux transporter periplasmic adaptor subunit [Asticcacaulis currens]